MIVTAWGSLGAREMNKKIAQFMKLECEQDCWRHIHATGSFGWRWMPDYVKEQGVELEKHPLITMQEYIYNMPELMAAADVVTAAPEPRHSTRSPQRARRASSSRRRM